MEPGLEKIALLAVTKLGGALCLAGVNNQREWVRPVRLDPGDWPLFDKNDITDKNGKTVAALNNVIALNLLRPVPAPGEPHVEDWEYDRTLKPMLVKTLNDRERLGLLRSLIEKDPDGVIEKKTRSLCLVEPEALIHADFSSVRRAKYKPELAFRLGGKELCFPVTDIHWRALGRTLAEKRAQGILREKELQSALGYKKIFLTLGLTRRYYGKYYPMVIGVHPFPFFPAAIDYQNL